VLAAALLACACDVGSQDNEPGHGPALHIVASYPADGQGLQAADGSPSCATPTPDCAVPVNAPIELRFDRFLLPTSGIPLGLRLYSGDPKTNGVGLSGSYDVLERVAVFRHVAPLQPNALYTAEVLPAQDSNQGFWAFDGAPLEVAGSVPFRFSFKTGSDAEVVVPPLPSVDTCVTIAPAFASCSGMCHTRPAPPMGLDLSDQYGFYYSAVARSAHEAQTGNDALTTLSSAARFGVEMPIIDPNSPATSYLIYKLLAKADNFVLAPDETCNSGFHAPVSDGACQSPSADEQVRLREWFVRGEAMPKNPPNGVASAHVDHATLQRITSWIAAGAACNPPATQ